jgi:hypothetical protein
MMVVPIAMLLSCHETPDRREVKTASGKTLVPERFWEKGLSACRFSIRTRSNLNPPLPRPAGSLPQAFGFSLKDPAKLVAELDRLKALGYGAIDLGQIAPSSRSQVEADPKLQWLIKTKVAHPALHNLSRRRKLPTGADEKHYAFLRTAADKSERILVVINMQPNAQQVEADVNTVATAGLVDLESGAERPREWLFRLELPVYGYKLYQVRPAAQLP